jgi:hypothetical protein
MKPSPGNPKKTGNLLRGAALLAASLALAACGEDPQPSQPPTPQVDPMFQQQREALDKARGVEQDVAKSAEELKRAEEEQTQ